MKIEDVMSYSNLSFLAEKAMEGFVTGIHHSPLHGFSVEFAEHRPYNQGENIKNLDWKLLAKTEKKYIKQYIEETNLRCHFWIDGSGSMRFPEKTEQKLKFALLAASGMATFLHKQRDAFRFNIYSENELLWESDLKSTRAHLHFCIEQLKPLWEGRKKASIQSDFEFSSLLKGIKRRNMIVILSDFLFLPDGEQESQFWDTLSYLHFLKCEVLLLHITDHSQERFLELGDQPIKFIDLETQLDVKLHPSEYANIFKESELKRIANLKDKANSLGVRYYDCDVSEDLENALQYFYMERQRLT